MLTLGIHFNIDGKYHVLAPSTLSTDGTNRERTMTASNITAAPRPNPNDSKKAICPRANPQKRRPLSTLRRL